jgi:2-polyprenyl-6-methoxyphenol hydroxylase-like FAD-dependent oxidoreductase
VPFLADRVEHLRSWQQTSLLQVEVGRVPRWYRPGLLLIGDAAHVMSPVGGVGINCAIQDAVLAAGVLGPRLLTGELRTDDLARVQQAREWAVRLTQACQRMMQRRIAHGPRGIPGLLFGLPFTRRLISQVMATGSIRRVTAKFHPVRGPHPKRVRLPVAGQ